MFTKVLIANRGAIACRIIRTLQNLNVQSVTVYSQADSGSLHVSEADESVSLGEGTAAQTYLNQDKLINIAKQAGAQAIHPGYGFLSENPEFAQRCEQEGIVFLGPTAEQMTSFGLKHTARELAEKSQTPLLPGTGLLASLDKAKAAADDIGFPVILKSTAGGGGIGMQICFNQYELENAYDSVKRLSENNFGNAGIFLEKFVEYARHIEVQIFGDGQGQVVALGERDCSTQRRNQKVIEETPAPNLSDDLRQLLQSAAIRLGQSVNYRSAGTVEFIVDQQSGEFYFLEVNTRLQVEHGVTEQVYGVDLVEWMVKLGAKQLQPLHQLNQQLSPTGHSIQVRLYAEDPSKNFQPCAGLLSHVDFPYADSKSLRIDTWVESGVEVSPFYDPMIAKMIATAESKSQAMLVLANALTQTQLYGIETNLAYLQSILRSDNFAHGTVYTRYLNTFTYISTTVDVLSAGTQTTVQDFPGRIGYWDIGVPPSGPMDDLAFRLGNRLLDNTDDCAGLEITLNGPILRFNIATQIVLTGAPIDAKLDGEPIPLWQVINVPAGGTLQIGKMLDAGARAYLLIKNGIDVPKYLGSRATFTLGQFGGHAGRTLQAGDVLHIQAVDTPVAKQSLPESLLPQITSQWKIKVIYGPHGAPDFFTKEDIDTFFATDWEVHYNSSRTGVRLIGPKPQWARPDGGEAGLHPSNIHDNAYAIGTIDFTGDMPVILGPDGPSLGGFVCPATIIKAERWKMGQLKAGDKVRFVPVSIEKAVALEQLQRDSIKALEYKPSNVFSAPITTPVIKTLSEVQHGIEVVYRPSGDDYLLVEYGPLVLDINLRFRVHALMLWLNEHKPQGMLELTPGIRSLQIHYDALKLPLNRLLDVVQQAEKELQHIADLQVPARIVHLPLSWDDASTQLAIEKYMQSVRNDAPWCPSNIEFIRRINGLESIEEVKRIVFNANYLVMGLGDVYLGAPVATPLDPRHRLVTTKYNPARTWTPENAVGIGGAYLCVYGMEGPGGYQFVGRTLQMWNRYKQTQEFSKPWLLRFFDQIRFFEVSGKELQTIRQEFPKGRYRIPIEETTFSLSQYNAFLQSNRDSIQVFKQNQQQAFDAERERWIATGQAHFEAEEAVIEETIDEELPDHMVAVESQVAGSIWKIMVNTGHKVKVGDVLLVVESMKMEIEIIAAHDGVVHRINRNEGQQVTAGQRLIIIDTK
ncbi:MAG: urea carboxylase [Gammaproteobacteria bacterium SG8_11]|nr:MAG: urea carboxylase [Gammaproteobacteria bacterium SG8_11]